MGISSKVAAALAAVCMAGAAHAERPDAKIWLRADAFFTSADSELRIDNAAGNTIGSTVSLEKDLGLPKRRVLPVGSIGVRLGRDFRVEGEFLRLKRKGSASITRPLTFDNTTYAAAANVAGLLESDTWRVALGWSPVRTDAAELGLSVGAHITRLRAQVLGIGTVAGTGVTALVAEERRQTAPLPTVGAYGSAMLNKWLSVEARADVLSLKIKDYRGALLDAQAGLTAWPTRNIGLGAGYRYVDYRLNVDKPSFGGRVSYQFHGPVAYAQLAF